MECEVRACRACLVTDARLCSLRDAPLLLAYQTTSGDQVHPLDGLPQHLCWECSARAIAADLFRQRCLRGQRVLRDLLLHYHAITENGIKSVDRHSTNLTSSLRTFHNRNHDASLDCNVKTELFDVIKEDDAFQNAQRTDECADLGDANLEYLAEVKREDLSPAPSLRSEARSDDDEPLARRAKPLRKREKKKKRKREKIKVAEKLNDLQTEGAEAERGGGPGRRALCEEFATVMTLSRDQQLAELHSRSNSLNYTNSPYRCNKCYKGFVDDSAYANHMMRHEPSSGAHVCDVCEIRCPTQRKLKSHVVAAHARKYACRACQHVSNTSNQAREHDKWHKGYTYECKLCGETFRKSTTHLTHVRLRHPTEFVCDVCGDSFVGKHGLAVHKKRTHRDAQEKEEMPACEGLYCSACDLHFSSEEAYKRHTVTSAVHSTDNDFGNGCRVCGEMLQSKEELVAHGLTHARKPATRADGRAHVKCEQCEATFASTRKCLAHFKRMHLGMKYPVKKNVVCEVCGKKCTSNATLAYHQRTHTGEKPFQCSECPKRFSIRQRLQIHERTHTGERPYPCSSCHKAFRHKPALNRHSRVHTGAKPYECNYCGKTFSQSNSMKLHVHTVHLKLPPPYRAKSGKALAATIAR